MRRIITGILALAAAAIPVRAANDLADVLNRMEQAEKDVQTLTFRFTQDVHVEITGEKQRTSGRATFQRPDRFRVEMSGAQAQTFVSDGTMFWLYNPARRQVMVDRWENWARAAGFPQGLTPFQMTPSQMKEKYEIALDGAPTPSEARLTFKPKNAGALAYTLRVTVDRRTGLPKRTILESSSVTSTLAVQQAVVNPPVKDDLFRFSPPEGVDVLDVPSLPGAPR